MPISIPGSPIRPPKPAPSAKPKWLNIFFKKKHRESFQQELDIHLVLTEIDDELININELEFRKNVTKRSKRIRKLVANSNNKKLGDYPVQIENCWAALKTDWYDKNKQKNLDILLNQIIVILESESP